MIKNKFLILTVLVSFFTACSSGSGSSNGDSSSTAPTSPSSPTNVPTSFSSLELNKLYKSNECVFMNSGARSGRYYFTRITSNEYLFELDVFNGSNCEQTFSLLQSTKGKIKINSFVSSTNNSSDLTIELEQLDLMPTTNQEAIDLNSSGNYTSAFVNGQYSDISNQNGNSAIGATTTQNFKFETGVIYYTGLTFQ